MRIAPKTAVAAHSNATTATIPLIFLALTTVEIVAVTKSSDTGTSSPISSASCALDAGDPNTNDSTVMRARTSGKSEKSA